MPRPVTILVAHNAYRQPGGEDAVFADEVRLLRDEGHDVVEYTETNARIGELGMLRAAARTLWSTESYRRMRSLIREHQPDIVHFHNTFLMISPSAYYACHEAGIPVVQTLHNFRLLCPAASLFRSGAPCDLCLGKTVKWPAVQHACYRGSQSQSAVVATMLAAHNAIGTWKTKIDLYLALSEFSRDRFIWGGVPADRIRVKPNFVFGPERSAALGQGEVMLFAGRLSPEKGIEVLLRAWDRLPDVPLTIAGDGPMRDIVVAYAAAHPHVRYLGAVAPSEMGDLFRLARAVIVPSACYENFPRVIAEGYAWARPIIASRLGALAGIVHDAVTGWLFGPGSADDLASNVRLAWENPQVAEELGRNARLEYERQYTPSRNYEMLLGAYTHVLHEARL